MTSLVSRPTSNRRDQLTADFYRATADVIGIFWQFHSQRVRTGNIDFATTVVPENHNITVPFHPARALKDQGYRRPIEGFNVAVIGTMNSSLTQFIKGNSVPLTQDYQVPFRERNIIYWPPNLVEPNDPAKRFFDPFVAGKISEAARLHQQLRLGPYHRGPEQDNAIAWRNAKFGSRVVAGEQTGVRVTTQLRALFAEELKITMPIALANISLANFHPTATDEIGLGESIPTYPLLDNSKLGLDTQRLSELGRGDSLGCPAAMRVSPETEAFLSERVKVLPPTMLHDFAVTLPAQFDLSVGSWFRGLPHEERLQIIHPDELRVLTGEARSSALEIRETQGCPYGHGKER